MPEPVHAHSLPRSLRLRAAFKRDHGIFITAAPDVEIASLCTITEIPRLSSYHQALALTLCDRRSKSLSAILTPCRVYTQNTDASPFFRRKYRKPHLARALNSNKYLRRNRDCYNPRRSCNNRPNPFPTRKPYSPCSFLAALESGDLILDVNFVVMTNSA